MNHSQLMALIPNGPLSITDELIHKDLDEWSKDLLEELDGEIRSGESNKLNVCAYLNQAALITSIQGNLEEARNLCQLQIGWLKEKINQEGLNVEFLFSILQPWINLGRLNHIQQKYAQAIPHFDMAAKVQRGENIRLEGFEIKYQQVSSFLADPQRGPLLDKYLTMNYVDGLIKIYISSGNYLEGMAFVEKQQSQAGRKIEFLLEECELILLLKMGKYDQASSRAQQFKPKNPFKKLILLYYTTLISLLTDQEENARRYGLKLAGYLGKASKEGNFIDLKKLLFTTAKLCQIMGLGQSAHNLYQTGFDLSSKLDDQRYCISFGLGLSESNMISDHEKSEILAVIESHLSVSHYKIKDADRLKVFRKAKPDGHLQKLQQFIHFTFAA